MQATVLPSHPEAEGNVFVLFFSHVGLFSRPTFKWETREIGKKLTGVTLTQLVRKLRDSKRNKKRYKWQTKMSSGGGACGYKELEKQTATEHPMTNWFQKEI